MDNQHRHIKGYRELTEAEISLINSVKEAGKNLDAMLDNIHRFLLMSNDSEESIRWLSIGRTDLQKGLMAVTRAIAKPEGF